MKLKQEIKYIRNLLTIQKYNWVEKSNGVNNVFPVLWKIADDFGESLSLNDNCFAFH